MQKIKAKIPVFLMIITVISACALHLFQFFMQADIPVSLPVNNNSPYVIYALLFFNAVFAVICCAKKEHTAGAFDFESKRSSVFLSVVMLAAAFFYDFIHQGYNCYLYISGGRFVEYSYICSMIISGIFALVSCFYFITLAMSAKNESYDFRNFTFLHFAPVVWAFAKLVGMMVKIMDIRLNTEEFCELILLCVILYFLFNMITAVDKRDNPMSKSFVFSSYVLVSQSCVVALPRIVMIFIGRGTLIDSADFSSSTYMMLGIFAFILLADINAKVNQKN